VTTERLLTIQLARQRWALRLSDLAGVCEMPALRRLPGVAAPVLGLAHRHGSIVTVLDLPALLQDAPGAGTECLLLVTPPRGPVALWVRGELRLTGPDHGAESAPSPLLDLARLLAPIERSAAGT
jgi:chemotaxis signal transduction protein